jgi:hypothetical protein
LDFGDEQGGGGHCPIALLLHANEEVEARGVSWKYLLAVFNDISAEDFLVALSGLSATHAHIRYLLSEHKMPSTLPSLRSPELLKEGRAGRLV